MKTVKVVMAVVIGVALMMPAAFAAEPKYSGFLGEYSANLQPGPEGGAKMRWLKPGIDFSKYNKLMVDSVIFYFAEDSEEKGINAEEMKELSDAFNQEIVNALKDKYPIVADPGPDVARLKIAITGVKKSKPGVSAVTSVLPVGIGISLIKKGVGGSYSGSGGTHAEFMALDSMSNDVIGAAADERTAGYTERFTSLGSAKEAFKFWAGRIATFMDSTRAAK
jgi:hypothetical protein